jgi:hypothetical protein
VKYAKHRSRCVDNINMNLTEFSSLAVVNGVMNLRNPSKLGNCIDRPERESASKGGSYSMQLKERSK